MKKIIILDYATATVIVFTYDSTIYNSGEEFIITMNEIGIMNTLHSNCHWMIVDSLNIKIED